MIKKSKLGFADYGKNFYNVSSLKIQNQFWLLLHFTNIVQLSQRGPNLSRATITATVSLFDHGLRSIVKSIHCEIFNSPTQIYYRSPRLGLWLNFPQKSFTCDVIYLSAICRYSFWDISCRASDNWSIPDRAKLSYSKCCGAKTKFDIESSSCSSRSSYTLCKSFSIGTITWI